MAANKSTPPVRFCEWCGKQLERKRYGARAVESYTELAKRRFCDRSCKGMAHRVENPVGGLAHRGRKIARRKKPRVVCIRCGGTARLQVHHKDGDATNNILSNLEVYCLWCHRKEHKHEGCSVPGCLLPYRGLGYCYKHYWRFKKYGDPLIRCFGRGKPQRVTE